MKFLSSLLFLLSPLFLLAQQPTHPTLEEALLNVTVQSENGKPSEGDIIIFTGKVSGKSFEGITNETGKFSILIPKADTYVVKYKSFGGDDEYTELEIPDVEGFVNFDFEVIYELPKVYTLENVFFDTGKSTLKSSSFPSLDNLAELMSKKKKLKIEVGGHTDDVGEDDANQKLSEARAKAVVDYLVKKGISRDRLVSKGYGESSPRSTNDTAEGRSQNRRTEIKILED